MREEKRLVHSEYAGAALGDQRLNSRLQKIAGTLEANPDVGFPDAMTEAELEAFYRFLSNDRVEPERILAPHVQATLGRWKGQDTVLCVHDTTKFRFNTPREGLGQYGGQTLFGHVSMAVGRDGVPLGVMGLLPWARGKDTVSQRRRRGELSDHESVALPSEQDRWMLMVNRVESRIEERTRVLHVMDSEADDYDVLRTLVRQQSRFIIRAAGNRRLQSDDDEPSKLKEFVSSCPVVCTRSVALSKRQKTRFRANTKLRLPRQSRAATLSIGAGAVALRAPPYYGKDVPRSLALHVVWVREIDAPDEVEPVEWTLMTTDPIDTLEQILAVVDGYRHRWKIEELFKALKLKTGCAYEKRQLGSYRTLVNALALLLPIAWNLLRLRTLAHDGQKLPAATVLSSVELQVLHHVAENPLPKEPTLRQAMLAIARLGGHLKRNGEPGWLVLGRGYLKLLDLAQGFLIARRCDQS